MVSLFPDPGAVKTGAVEYIANPQNVGFVAIGFLMLCLAFAVGWVTRSLKPGKREVTTNHIIRALNDETYDQTILTPKTLVKIMGWLPKWITFPDRERVAWLNRAAAVWWPFLNRAISNSVVSSVEPILNRLVAGAGVGMRFSKFTLDIEAKWAATEPEVQLDVQFMGITLPIAIEKVEFFGVVRIVFGPLCDWWPSFSAMQVAFIGKPTINFNLRLIGGDITAFPFIEKLLTNLIKNVLVNLMVWPNKLDIGITNDLGAKSVSNSGIVRICVKRALHLPQVDRLKSASKMRPAVELIVTDGEYGRAKVIRYLAFPNSKSRLPVCRLPRVPDCTARLWRPDYGATTESNGQDPEFGEQTFDIRVHDIRGAKLSLCVVDTATTYKSIKEHGKQFVFTSSKSRKKLAADDDEPVSKTRDELLEEKLAVSRMSKTEKGVGAYSTIEGQRSFKKTTMGTLGMCEYEIGRLVDTPYVAADETLNLSDRKTYSSKMARAFKSSKRDSSGNLRLPQIEFSAKYLPFDLERETEAQIEKVRGMSLEDIIAGGDLAQFCGVLHVRLLRGDNLVSKDANGRSDPFVKLSVGKQLHKSSTKKETLNPVWDEEFDFVVGMAELENKTRLRLEVWDWDYDGKREYMGVMSLDVKRVIGQILLLAGQASRVLKRVDELEETSSGRLHVELEFYSVRNEGDKKKVNAAIDAQAAQEVAMESAMKQRSGGGGKNGSGKTKTNSVAGRKREMMKNMSRTIDAAEAAAAKGEGKELSQEQGVNSSLTDAPVSETEETSPKSNATETAAKFHDLAQLYRDDAPAAPVGCIRGCFGGGGSSSSSSSKKKKNVNVKPNPTPGSNSLPKVEPPASPLPGRKKNPSFDEEL